MSALVHPVANGIEGIESISKSPEVETFWFENCSIYGIFLSPNTKYTIRVLFRRRKSVAVRTKVWADGRPPSRVPIPQSIAYLSDYNPQTYGR